MTIDVEDYFQVSAFAPVHRARQLGRARMPGRAQRRPHPRPAGRRRRARPPSSRWAGSPSAIRSWCAASSPAATNWPATATATCAPPTRTAPNSPTTSRRSKALLEDIGGQQVLGYRAPSFSIGTRQPVGARRAAAKPATATAPASTRSSTTTTACRTRRASRSTRTAPDGLLEVPITTVQLMASATCRPAAAATSACCPTRCRAG